LTLHIKKLLIKRILLFQQQSFFWLFAQASGYLAFAAQEQKKVSGIDKYLSAKEGK